MKNCAMIIVSLAALSAWAYLFEAIFGAYWPLAFIPFIAIALDQMRSDYRQSWF